MNKEKKFLTAQEVANRYGVKVETVYTWKWKRILPYIKRKGNRTVFPLEALEKLESEGFRDARQR